MKVRICPICANKIGEIELCLLEITDVIWCYHCDNYFIPLVTPQEERND